MTALPDSDVMLRLGAALDNELDAAGMLAFEREMANDPRLAAEYQRIAALQAAARDRLPKAVAPAALRQRVAAMGAARHAAPHNVRAARPPQGWLALAATALLAAGLGSAATLLATAPWPPSDASRDSVAAHMRGLLATTPVDVASSDRHTVKPWFNAHLAISPPVPDLASQGYALVGGRVDVLGGRAAPTLVYRLREHLISVTAVALTPSASQEAARTGTSGVSGFGLARWRSDEFAFTAVSDIERQELDAFVAAFKAAQNLRP